MQRSSEWGDRIPTGLL
ncbi:MAG: hypothetical protein EXQ58_05355 [Acidobacteria bacterium]|nr:hypothetical protein [Acidobacteriota bacterium]